MLILAAVSAQNSAYLRPRAMFKLEEPLSAWVDLRPVGVPGYGRWVRLSAQHWLPGLPGLCLRLWGCARHAAHVWHRSDALPCR